MNPLEEFLDEYGTKEANNFTPGGVAGTFGNAMVNGIAMAGTAALIGGAGIAAAAIHNAATKGRDFRGMMEFNPDLQAHHEQDPKVFNQLYTSLRTANPAYAKDPVIAGTYMRKMMDSPHARGGFLTEAMSGIPSSHGAFGRDVMNAGRDAAMGTLKDEFSGPFHGMDHKEPSDMDRMNDLKGQRGLAAMQAAQGPKDAHYFGPGGGKGGKGGGKGGGPNP